jgi:hypothetical protein
MYEMEKRSVKLFQECGEGDYRGMMEGVNSSVI